MVFLTEETHAKISPAVKYGYDITSRFDTLKKKRNSVVNNTDELIGMLYNGKINLTIDPFIFEVPQSVINDLTESRTIKIDHKILSIYSRTNWSWRSKRFSAIGEDEFINHFIPAWKDEYKTHLRFQIRDIFSDALKIVKLKQAAKPIEIKKTYDVEPKTFYEYPSDPIQIGDKLTMAITDYYGIHFYENPLRSDLSTNRDRVESYPILYEYRDQLEDLYRTTKKFFVEDTKLHESYNEQLREVLSPILISKELFLEYNE